MKNERVRAWAIEGRRVERVTRAQDLVVGPPAAWIVRTDRLAAAVRASCGRLPTALHVVPAAEGSTPGAARRQGDAVLGACGLALGEVPATVHARAVDALRAAVEAPVAHGPHRLLCADPGRHLQRWLDFRAAWPAWRQGTGVAPTHPALRATIELAARDPHFERLVRAAGPPLQQRRPSTFTTLARAIVHQQLSGRAAATIWRRLEEALRPQGITAARVVGVRTPRLRAAGLSAAKAAALKDLATRVVGGQLSPRGLTRLDDDEVIARLTAVRGIGPWSAQMHLLFSLGRLDVWPALDLGVRKGLARWYGLDPEPDVRAAEALGEGFRPWRSVAAWYLWRATELPAPPRA